MLICFVTWRSICETIYNFKSSSLTSSAGHTHFKLLMIRLCSSGEISELPSSVVYVLMFIVSWMREATMTH